MYSVYILQVPDGRVYVGATSTSTKTRWNNGNGYRFCKKLWEQIEIHGWDAIKKNVVASGLTKEEASKLEQKLITVYRSNNPQFGFNRELGGIASHKIISAESRSKMSASSTGVRNHNYGTHFSAEHRRKLSESNQGKKRSKETCRNIGKAKEKPVAQFKNGAYVATYPSGKVAAKQTGVQAGHISKVCKGQRMTAGGYTWSYA